jgi:hypothetical protein
VIWNYFKQTNIDNTFRNFNGGLSLRNRYDMIIIINLFPPLKTTNDQSNFLSENEDVYFLTGCIELGFPIGDNEESAHFALQEIYYDKYFGIHQPYECVSNNVNKSHIYLKFLNVSLKLLK